MHLARHLWHVNHELKNILLGFYLSKSEPVNSEMISYDLGYTLSNSGIWIPSAGTIHEYLAKFKKEGLVRCVDEGPNTKQKYVLLEEMYSTAARFLLKHSIENDISMMKIFGLGNQSQASIKSSLENRIDLLFNLAKGEKTLSMIEKDLGMQSSAATHGLRILSEAGIVDLPGLNTLDGNTYEIGRSKTNRNNLNEFFKSLLFPPVDAALQLCRKGKPFTVYDVAKIGDCSESYAARKLKDMGDNGLLSSQVIKNNKIYSVSDKYLTGKTLDSLDFSSLEDDAMQSFLSETENMFYKFYKEKLRNRKTNSFRVVDLKPYFNGVTNHTIRNTVKKAISKGYVFQKTDCVNDKFYSLSKKGKAFINDCLIPLKKHFRTQENDEVYTNGDLFYADVGPDFRDYVITKAMILYAENSRYLKRKSACERAAMIMGILQDQGEMSKSQIMQGMGALTNGIPKSMRYAFQYAEDQNYIHKEKQGPFSMYTLTPKGAKRLRNLRCD
ncbi:ArsR family transcriptional regulator [Thermoproteota archaeon]